MEHTISIAGKWGYSEDGEYYSGAFETQAEAAEAGFAESESDSLEIGRYRAPERLRVDRWQAERFIESCEDDRVEEGYGSDWDNRTVLTTDQMQRLAELLTHTLLLWEHREGRVPTWGVIDHETVEVVTREHASAAESAGV